MTCPPRNYLDAQAESLSRVEQPTPEERAELIVAMNPGSDPQPVMMARRLLLLAASLREAEQKGKEAYDWAMHERDMAQHHAAQEQETAKTLAGALAASSEKLHTLEARLRVAEEARDSMQRVVEAARHLHSLRDLDASKMNNWRQLVAGFDALGAALGSVGVGDKG